MSKKNYLLLFILALCLCSCNDSALPVEKAELDSSMKNEFEEMDGVYPYSQQCKTRARSVPNWESWEKVRLSSGVIGLDSVAVPWSENAIVITTIPTQVRKDIKSENGWMLVKYTVNGNWGKNNNYMIFYNRYTGVLKVFYYLDNPIESSAGIWQLQIDVPQKLFAFVGELADPIQGLYNRQEIYCTNITSTESTSFVHGWNCFQVELAYDPQFTSGTLTINPVNRTNSQINLTGSYGSSSKGTLITTTTTNPASGTIDGLAKAAGEDAFTFIKEEAKGNKFGEFVMKHLGNIAKEGVSAIVKGGVNMLFSSFIGRFNKETTQNYDLQFTTNGKAELSGNILTETTGGIAPGSLNLSKASLGVRLGVWNLSEQPTIYFDTTARLHTWNESQNPIYDLWKMKGDLLDNTNCIYQFIINPDIEQYLVSSKCRINIFRQIPLPDEISKYPHGSIARSGGIWSGAITEGKGTNLYENYYETSNYYSKFYVKFTSTSSNQSPPQRYLFLPKGNIEYVSPKVGIEYNSLIKATATIIVNNNVNDTIVITKTYAPKLEWNPNSYQQNEKDYGAIQYMILRQQVYQ